MNDAELILNPDGSVYHLNLLPEDLAPTIILVGDKDRAAHERFTKTNITIGKDWSLLDSGLLGPVQIFAVVE